MDSLIQHTRLDGLNEEGRKKKEGSGATWCGDLATRCVSMYVQINMPKCHEERS